MRDFPARFCHPHDLSRPEGLLVEIDSAGSITDDQVRRRGVIPIRFRLYCAHGLLLVSILQVAPRSWMMGQRREYLQDVQGSRTSGETIRFQLDHVILTELEFGAIDRRLQSSSYQRLKYSAQR